MGWKHCGDGAQKDDRVNTRTCNPRKRRKGIPRMRRKKEVAEDLRRIGIFE